jgi:hypothetical protein
MGEVVDVSEQVTSFINSLYEIMTGFSRLGSKAREFHICNDF